MRRAAGVNQLAGRDSASGRGGHGSRLGGPAGLSLRARGLGVRPASPAGLIFESRATGFDQPGRGETSSGRWTAWLSQLGGTHPAGAGLRDSTSRSGGTEPPSTWSTSLPVGTELPGSYGGVRPAGLEGLSLRARCHGGRPAVPAGLGLRARCSTSRTGGTRLRARGSSSLPGRCEPLGAGRASPPASTAGLRLRARGPRRSTSWPGGTLPPGSGCVVSTRLPCGTHRSGAGHGVRPDGQAGNSLRTLGCGAQSARRY